MDYNFTQEELARINQLYGTDFVDITPDDASLIGRWEARKALKDSEHEAKLKTYKEDSRAKIEDSKRIADKAISNLEELKNAAIARLERLE